MTVKIIQQSAQLHEQSEQLRQQAGPIAAASATH